MHLEKSLKYKSSHSEFGNYKLQSIDIIIAIYVKVVLI